MAVLRALGEPEVVDGVGPGLDLLPRISALQDGGYILVFNTAPSFARPDTDVYAQRYDASGVKVGSVIPVTTLPGGQASYSVTTLTNGGFVVSFVDNGQNGPDKSGNGAYAQLFSPAGSKVGGPILLNSTTADEQTELDIVALTNGGFAATWRSDEGQDGSPDSDVLYQAFSATGAKVGVERSVISTDSVTQSSPAIAALSNGFFAVAWEDADTSIDGSLGAIRVSIFDPAGVSNASPILVNTTATGSQTTPEIITLTGGGFAVAWLDDPSFSVRFQLFDDQGVKLGSEQVASEPNTIRASNLQGSALADGGFTLTWTHQVFAPTTPGDPPESGDSFARTFDAAGAASSAQVQLGTPARLQVLPAVTTLADGALVFSWTDLETNSSDVAQDVFVQQQRWALFEPIADLTAGADTVIGTTSRDYAEAGGGSDTVFGGGAIDWLEGNDGDDYLSGDDGDDLLFGGRGADVLLGGDGQDVLEATGSFGGEEIDDGPDQLIGGDGIDTASYALAVASVRADLTGAVAALGEAVGDTFSSIENLTGSFSSDVLWGDAGANVLKGGRGSDILVGRGGADRLVGGDGSDTASYESAAAAVLVDMTLPTAGVGEGAGDVLESIEIVTGSAFADTLRGTTDSQSLNGNNGDDVLEGRGGGDVLAGGAGNDTASYSTSRSGVTADLAASGNNTGDAAGDTYSLIENLRGSSSADTLRGDAGANYITGNAGADTVQGRDGADKLFGEAGSDLLFGEVGDDTLDGGEGGDTLLGGDGGDVLVGREGADNLDGGAGTDVADFREKTSAVVLTLNGATTSVALVGGVAEDSVRNVERIYGGGAADVLTGDAAGNLLSGYAGADVLRGAGGADFLVGGANGDRFVFAALGDSTVATSGRDTITDFVSGTDKIDVSGIDANTTAANNQAFVFGAMTAGQSGRLQVTANGTNSWLVQGDVNADGLADFAIVVNGGQPVAADFIL